MVELKGSEKQVSWANDIREVVLKGAKKLVEIRAEEHEERGKKRTLRMLEEAKEALNKIEEEESSKYFIDNFSYILRNMKDYEIEAEVSNVDLELIIAYKMKDELGL
ncbi:hypothetical protein [Clostridium sp. 1001275B_160808_H3]|uniref:hypothetical protein n=1 Tax=Clostridium sp. 1001275B_160808_H3 TaxID=2787110 RepID=UPI00189992C3|nr:hypothetical protein [Clostridium sp. 1001275B_160808_H3]